MKYVYLILLCLASFSGNAQQRDSLLKDRKPIKLETVKTFMGPNKAGMRHVAFILNDVFFKDSATVYRLLRQFQDNEVRIKYYNPQKSLKKFHVEAKEGIIYCRTRKKILIDYKNLKIIKQE